MALAEPSTLHSELSLAEGHAAVHLEFGSIYDSHVDFVHRNVRRLGVSESSVDDVVQKVFLVVHQRLPDFEQRSSLKTWIFAILLRVVREERRTLRRRFAHWFQGASAEPEELPSLETPYEMLSRAEAGLLVMRLLDTLEADKREVFVLAELEEMTAKEIGEITGLSSQAVYSRLRAARIDFERAAAGLRRTERLRSP